MADDVYTTLLNFVSDSAEANRDIKGMTENLKKMRDEVEKVSTTAKSPGGFNASDFGAEMGEVMGKLEEEAKKFGIVLSDSLKNAIRSSNFTVEEYAKATDVAGEILGLQKLQQARERERDAAVQALSQKAALHQKEASILTRQASIIRNNVQLLRNQAQQIQGISQVVLGAGVGIVGGIFGLASKYVKDAKEATAVTVEWKAAQESLAKSGQKIGAVLAKEALPLLRLATATAAKAAEFVEKHPELVQAAINVGLVTAGLGAVGLAVSKGIKLYADQLYLSSIPLQLEAGRLQFAAAQEQLVAARLKAGLSAAPTAVPGTAAAGASTGLLGTILAATAAIAIGVIVAKYAVDLVNLILEKSGAAKAIAEAQKEILEKSRRPYPGIIAGARPQNGVSGSTPGIDVPTGVRASAQFEAILKAYEDYKRDDLKLVQKHYVDRQKIISDSLAQENKVNAEYARDVTRINSQRGKSIAEATRSYEEQSIKAEQQFATERARIVRDGGIEIQRMEEQLQENLRKMRKDHEDRLGELVASRDALGIVKEQQRYNSERSEEVRQANLEIRQRRADLALRLADLQQNFIQERNERFVEFQARLVEIRTNAAQQLKELAERHREELAQIRIQRIERIQELDAAFKDERARRREYLLDQIRELDAGLLGEAELRKQRQAELIAELDRFLLQYNDRAGSIAQQAALTAVRARGGYATYGTYLLGDAAGGGRGKPEYVMNGGLTELAERVMGGQISQGKMAALLNAFNGGSNKNVTYNDSRRIDSRISSEDREKLVDDTFSAIYSAIG